MVILDDEPSIHGAWNTQFESILKIEHNIKIKHFQNGKQALDFIQSFSNEEKNKIFLLADYELLKQELNGLHVISMSKIHRSILVTSHFANQLVLEQAAKTNTRILPKHLASEILIEIDDILLEEKENSENIDFVIVDDDENFINSLLLSIFSTKEVDKYTNPEDFLKNLFKYSLGTKFFIDNNYSNSNLKGLEIAKQVYQKGYKNIYVLSGHVSNSEQVASYITVITKTDIESIKNVVDVLL